MLTLNSKQKVGAIIIIVLLLGFLGYLIWESTNESTSSTTDIDLENDTMMHNASENVSQEQSSAIIIHITGSVNNPGIVKIQDGSRISDAIDAAGGLLPEADMSKVNLAYPLEDGQKVYIPSTKELEEEQEYISSDSGQNILVETEPISSSFSTNSPQKKGTTTMINLNTATQSELESLDGIGPSTASKIIEYRHTNGKFNTIEDIKNVRGIGDAKFNSIKNKICVK